MINIEGQHFRSPLMILTHILFTKISSQAQREAPERWEAKYSVLSHHSRRHPEDTCAVSLLVFHVSRTSYAHWVWSSCCEIHILCSQSKVVLIHLLCYWAAIEFGEVSRSILCSERPGEETSSISGLASCCVISCTTGFDFPEPPIYNESH